MSIKTIYANGCSWTAGDGAHTAPENKGIQNLDARNYSWPKYLGEIMHCDVINDSAGGGSNTRILRTTMDFVAKLPAEKRKETLIIIGWSTPDRDEIFIDNDWYRFNAGQKFSSYTDVASTLSSNTVRQVDKYQEQYITEIYSSEAALQKYFQQLYLLKNLLENLSIPFLFFLALPWKWGAQRLTPAEEKHFGHLVHHISGPNVIDILTSMNEYVAKRKLPMSPCIHPWPETHQIWSSYLFSELIQRKIIGEANDPVN